MPASAQSVAVRDLSPVDRQLLLLIVLNEIESRQAALAEESELESAYFNGDFEAEYDIEDGRLVQDNRLVSRSTRDHQIWDYFRDIAGSNFTDRYMKEFRVYDSPESPAAGYVETMQATDPMWILSVNVAEVDLQDSDSRGDLLFLLVHEYAHILSLNLSQLNFNQRESSCREYYVDIGCLYSDSYLNQFVEEYWSQSMIDYAETSAEFDDRDTRTERLESFFQANEDEFVSEYAATNPEEDFAESFADFIFYDKPRGSLGFEQKSRFFYDYHELVRLRTDIRDFLEEEQAL